MDSLALKDLLTALPQWSTRLQEVATRFAAVTVGPVVPVDPSTPTNPVANPIGTNKRRPESPPLDDPVRAVKKLDSKPPQAKAKFSSITGPQILYDGESQKVLYDCVTALNAKRGALRKELMAIRRKKVLTLPTANYGYSDDDEEEDGEEEEVEETASQKEQRIAAEKKKEQEEKLKAEKEKKRGEILEYVDGCLDKTVKACENAAFLWLKGDGCPGHAVAITNQMREAITKIKETIAPPKPAPVKATLKPEEPEVDEGFDEEVEYGEEEEELPHKTRWKPDIAPEQDKPRPPVN